jgi:hypothetical protein
MKILAEHLFELLETCFHAGLTVKIDGPPGAGKSKQIEAFARLMNIRYAADGGYGLFVLDCSKANIADLLGYLMPKTETHIDAYGKAVTVEMGKYTYPHWAFDWFTGKPAFAFKHGCIVLEEWGQGEGEVKRGAAPLIYDRRLGEFRFDGFDMVVLSNRAGDRSGVTKEYDFIINRWTEVELQPTLEGFLEASHVLGMLPLTQAFAARNERDLFHEVKVPDKQGPWMTQRSLHKLDDLVQAAQADGMPFDSKVLMAAAAGTVGPDMATRYMAFAEARSKIPSVATIIADPEGTKIPEEMDVLTFLIFDLASKTKRENIKAICQYVRRMKQDMAVTYFHSACSRDETLVSTAEFSKFAMDNLGVLTAVAARKAKMARK